ncbi:hypothetical protein GGS24DRAFT_58553 [Hypoxylon argillaceum]|nr:hypothetical protein GGS24DRAFT_58553 [Hypoxylon argillaceum]
MPASPTKKRIIICCDGTWQNSDNGYVKSNRNKPVSRLQIPSNVTRISKCFRRTCSDGVFQIIYYQSGVGSRSGVLDRLFGGAFGIGISENIREAYAFLCANYVDGDKIVLLGFSRGAFTARSIGGMVSDLGLLNRNGMDYFFPIFKDMQNWTNEHYDDPFPTIPFTNKPKGEGAAAIYRERLIENYTRVKEDKGQGGLIQVLAIGVWDTVGSLGIPDVEFLSRLGIKRCTHEYQFYNTHLSTKIQHGFHALALDETRGPFTPTLWERRLQEQDTSDLRQVWFPGSHANIGGGWPDQGVADTTLAWMMDQLSSVGCEFLPDALEKVFEANVKYYTNRQLESGIMKRKKSQHLKHKPSGWAAESIYESNQPIRPWGLHSIQSANSFIYDLLGSISRAPGMYKKINPKNGRPLPEFLEDTNERIHPSVRVRLACEGLGLNDREVWDCPSLLKYWRLRRVTQQFSDPVSRTAEWGPPRPNDSNDQATATSHLSGQPESSSAAAAISAESLQMLSQDPSERWTWEYIGPENTAPAVRVMLEENMGPFEQRLLELAAGKVHVCKYAEEQDVNEFKAFHLRSFRKMMQRLHKKWHIQQKKAMKRAKQNHGA